MSILLRLNRQWFNGKIYSERCSLSPDGTLFIYFALQKNKVQAGYRQSYTAISKPPWLTALALWPQGDTWGGGGVFTDNKSLTIGFSREMPHHPDHPPRELTIDYALRSAYQLYAGLPVEEKPHGVILGKDLSGQEFCSANGVVYRIINKQRIAIHDFNDTQPAPMYSPNWARQW